MTADGWIRCDHYRAWLLETTPCCEGRARRGCEACLACPRGQGTEVEPREERIRRRAHNWRDKGRAS